MGFSAFLVTIPNAEVRSDDARSCGVAQKHVMFQMKVPATTLPPSSQQHARWQGRGACGEGQRRDATLFRSADPRSSSCVVSDGLEVVLQVLWGKVRTSILGDDPRARLSQRWGLAPQGAAERRGVPPFFVQPIPAPVPACGTNKLLVTNMHREAALTARWPTRQP